MGLLPDNHVYSYSQLEQISQCPYAFYMQRIEKQPTVDNAFAQQGSLVHELIDMWAKGQIEAEDLPYVYEIRYPQMVTASFPAYLATKGYATKAYEQCLDYFKNFDRFKGYDIIGTETKFQTEIEGRPFVGIIDMVLKDQETGELIVLDHKSKSLSSFKKEQDAMYRQQTIYAKAVHEAYDQWPDTLMFNLFKENGLKQSRPFSMEVYNETMDWAVRQIEKIETYDLMEYFETCEPGFFCENICSVRNLCPNAITKQRR